MLRTFAEWRRPGSTCRGGLVWFARDLSPGAGWGVLDSTGRPKAAYWYLKRALAPVALLDADEGLNGLWLHAVNDTAEPIEAELRVALYRDGRLRGEPARTTLTIPARGHRSVHADALFERLPRSHLRLPLRAARRTTSWPPRSAIRATGALRAAACYFPARCPRQRGRHRAHGPRGSNRRRDMRWCSRPNGSRTPSRSMSTAFCPTTTTCTSSRVSRGASRLRQYARGAALAAACRPERPRPCTASSRRRRSMPVDSAGGGETFRGAAALHRRADVRSLPGIMRRRRSCARGRARAVPAARLRVHVGLPDWRILAERLAALGFDALRFDYDGTGNSAGDATEPGPRRRLAPQHRLRDRRGPQALGVQPGGAGRPARRRAAGACRPRPATAASSDSCCGARSRPAAPMCASSRRSPASAARTTRMRTRTSRAINAAGYIVSGDDGRGARALDARCRHHAPAPRSCSSIATIVRSIRRRRPPEMLGSQRRPGPAEGTAEMLQPPQLAKVPEQALDEITTWFRDWHLPPAPRAPRGSQQRRRQHGGGPETTRSERSASVRAIVCSGSSHARPIRPARPAIILLNTGVEHHVGPHRLYVPLAREWAARGHLVLRFDLGGIGDSVPRRAAEENVAYPAHMLDDAREAIAFVRERRRAGR